MLAPSIFGRDIFDDFFGVPFHDTRSRRVDRKPYDYRKTLMRTDVKESEAGYELEIDLPGFKKEDLKVSLKEGYLTVRAEKEEEADDDGKNYIRRERFTGACQRTFFVGKDLSQEDIKGEFKNGILKLSVPKKEKKEEVPERKYISIEG